MDCRFTDREEIGSGAFGVVYKAFDLKLCRHVAIKRVEHAGVNGHKLEEVLRSAENEYRLMTKLRHENIVSVLDCVTTSNATEIVLEWLPSGSIGDLLRRQGRLHESAVRRFVADALRGLAFLHENNIVHADIKSGNWLLSSEGRVKISDFGTSRELTESKSGSTVHLVGTIRFMSPESIRKPKFSRAADIWAVGATCVMMLSGAVPWSDVLPPQDKDTIPTIFHIGNALPPNHHPTIPAHTSHELRDILERCFAFDPEQRPTAKELLAMPYFQGDELPQSAEPFCRYLEELRPSVEDEEEVMAGGASLTRSWSDEEDPR